MYVLVTYINGFQIPVHVHLVTCVLPVAMFTKGTKHAPLEHLSNVVNHYTILPSVRVQCGTDGSGHSTCSGEL